ncbi:hypothetical protein LZK98_02960 [Sphingomonas cannabina]|uniref:hypothetical protein n=1 Tax=Sphingomonas cannabina TaxID=2899123 RepID=UPI001F18E049|nr:hypothetical protein [Sphingomonas cannabina]UIJ45929.1 hypothetical protein LZK98_02960 [Sphingomonas cannabina]
MSGRPLRFLGLVTGGWVAARVLILWHETGSLPEAIRRVAPLPVLAAHPPMVTTAPASARMPSRAIVPGIHRIAHAGRTPLAPNGGMPSNPRRVQLALLAMSQFGPVHEIEQESETQPQLRRDLPALAALAARGEGRWSASSWLIVRGGTGLGASTDAPQLGGSQGGLRVDYALGHGFAATGRLAAPAAGAGRELALGIAWRPGRLPVRLVAERRIALDEGRGGPALGISGGVYTALPAGFRLEGYAQGGAIFRDGAEHYVDGIARAAHPVARLGRIDLDLGAGAWGGAQRGVARLDLGPSLGLGIPLADRTVRVSVDWRQRVAGEARPGSGLALSVGADF